MNVKIEKSCKIHVIAQIHHNTQHMTLTDTMSYFITFLTLPEVTSIHLLYVFCQVKSTEVLMYTTYKPYLYNPYTHFVIISSAFPVKMSRPSKQEEEELWNTEIIHFRQNDQF